MTDRKIPPQVLLYGGMAVIVVGAFFASPILFAMGLASQLCFWIQRLQNAFAREQKCAGKQPSNIIGSIFILVALAVILACRLGFLTCEPKILGELMKSHPAIYFALLAVLVFLLTYLHSIIDRRK